MNGRLLSAWDETCRRLGAKNAIVEAGSGQGVTFAELDARASAWISRNVASPGGLAGRPVVFSISNGIGWFEIFLALLRCGAVPVPLDAGEPAPARLRLARAVRAGFAWEEGKLVALHGSRRFRDSEICFIKLTSGSTGSPRALVFTGAQLLADGRQVTSTMGIGRRDVNYALIPFGHSYGLGNLTLPLLAHGVPLVCGSAPLPHAIAADFARWNPTVFPGVPAIWRALAGSAMTLESLRLGISAGAPLSPEVAREFFARFGRRLHNFYGSSETGGIAYDATGRVTLDGGVGRAMRGVRLVFRNRERLQVCSPAVTTYANRQRSGRNGCWLMPDRVARNGKGELTLLGRRGTTVKVGGRRVSLAEVAAALRKMSGVQDAWVGVTSGAEPMLGAVVASVRPAAELRAGLLAAMAAWKIPRKISVVSALPVNSRGKSDLAALRALAFGPAA